MAFEFHPWNAFQNEQSVFVLNGSIRTEEDLPYKLLILQDEIAENARFIAIEDFLTALLPILVVREFVDSVVLDVGKARRSIYRALSRRMILHGLRADIGLSRQLSREIMMIERVNVELENGKRLFHRSSLSGLMNDPEGHPAAGNRNLHDTIMGALDCEIKTVKSHVEVMAKSFSEHLLVRNMALMYALQWTILCLIIVSIVLGAASTVSNWDQIETFWHKKVRHEAPSRPKQPRRTQNSLR